MTIYGIIIAFFLFLMLSFFAVVMIRDVKEKPGQGARKVRNMRIKEGG